jgi:hypothetical protein
VQYLDANWIYPYGSIPISPASREDWWLHEPGFGDRAHRLSSSSGANLLNEDSPAVIAWVARYVRRYFRRYPALMMDDTSGSLAAEVYYSGFRGSEELRTNRAVRESHTQLALALTHRDGTPYMQIDNGLDPNPYVATSLRLLSHPQSVVGLVAEGAPIWNGTLTNFFSTLLDEMAYVDHTANDFAVLLSYDPSGSPRARRVQTATILLGYSPGHTVSWADLETNSSNLAVWPEQGIVPTHPIQSMSPPGGSGCLGGHGVVCRRGGHHKLQVAPGIYRREFRDCYNQGVDFGPCAVVINTLGLPVTVRASWLRQSYRHQITLLGGDVQSGGRIDLSGAAFAPGSTVVPAGDALLLSS